MGSFGFICNECGLAINADAGSHGEVCELVLIKDGTILEKMRGMYDSYGGVFNKVWSMDWLKLVDMWYADESDKTTGIVANHLKCVNPTTKYDKISKDDPNQGRGPIRETHTYDYESSHEVLSSV